LKPSTKFEGFFILYKKTSRGSSRLGSGLLPQRKTSSQVRFYLNTLRLVIVKSFF
jgi:hypothetical protein